jgi:HSP20 family protein
MPSQRVLLPGESTHASDSFDEIDRLLDRMNRVTGIDDDWNEGRIRVDLSEHDDELVVVADLPGFEREEIDLSVDDDRLVIAASDDQATADEAESYLRRERRATAIRRTIELPVAVDAAAAGASYTNGVLTVTLPKLVESEGHRIDVE